MPTDMKAIWVTRWDFKSPGDVEKIIRNCSDYGFNNIFFQVRGNATAYYESKYEPWAWELTGKDPSALGQYPGWDPLQTAIDAANLYDVKLHAYLNVYPGWRGKTPPPSNIRQVYTTHKNWFGRNEGGEYQPLGEDYVTVCPGIPAVRDYLEKVFLQVVKDYAIDGIHLDYVRYYNDLGEYSLDPVSIKLFQQKHKAHPIELPELWSQYKRDAVTDLVRRIYHGTKKLKPSVTVSAATWNSYYNGYSRFYQDSWKWLEEGILDLMTPMTYTPNTDLFKLWNTLHLKHSHKAAIAPAIGLLWDEIKVAKPYFEAQCKAVKTMRAPGVAVFAYKGLFPKNKANKSAEAFASIFC